MNTRCTICDAVLFARRAGLDRCPECGARPEFQIATTETPRHARSTGLDEPSWAWEFSPSGPVRRRLP